MEKYLSKLPQGEQRLISLISRVARDKNMAVYLVGGFVRDLILKRDNFDLDVVVEGDGIALARELAEILNAKIISHEKFGTSTVTLENGLKIDIATARLETYPHPGSLPEVTYSTLRQDLSRRDFTINAMAMSINKGSMGELVDFFAGGSDIKSGQVRILHDLSFIDDPTRILRAIRFEQRFGFKIEKHTMLLMKEAISQGRLHDIQPQRVRDELILDLKEPDVLKFLVRLNNLLGFSFIHQKLKIGRDGFILLRAIRNEINWYNKTYPKRRQLDSWLIYLMGLLDSFDVTASENVCRRFAFKRGEEKRILSIKELNKSFLRGLSSRKLSADKIYSMLEPLSYEAIIFLKAKYKNSGIKANIEDFLEIYNGMRLCICGQDLKDMGLKPGPSYNKIFVKALAAKLSGRITTKAEEVSFIKKMIKSCGLK